MQINEYQCLTVLLIHGGRCALRIYPRETPITQMAALGPRLQKATVFGGIAKRSAPQAPT